MTARTVEYDLSNAFRELDIGSRKELRAALAGRSECAVYGYVQPGQLKPRRSVPPHGLGT
jgi:hypothetical protein